MTTCIVCCEKFNKSSHKKINCNYCNYECCVDCMKNYILGRSENARCMNNDCKKVWNREVLLDKFTKKFVNVDYKKHRENILFEQQKALLPLTQEFAERVKEELSYKDECDKMKLKFKEKIKVLNDKITDNYRNNTNGNDRYIKDSLYRSQIKCIQKEMYFMSEHYKRIINRLRYPNQNPNNNVASTSYKITYIINCPNSECKGFISSKWKCGICESKVCNKCHVIIDKNEDNENDHECKEENILSAEMIMKDTKPCPNCAVRIHKINGCSQMYCTSCHTAFCWNTGNISTGVIHNPHYYEYINRNGNVNRFRNIGDQICGGIIDYNTLYNKIMLIYPKVTFSYGTVYLPVVTDYNPNLVYILNIHRLYNHIQADTMRRYVVNVINDMRDDRINYILNRLSENEFKIKLQKYEKEVDKKNDIRLLLEMFQNTTVDIFRKINQANTIKECNQYIDELVELRLYFNNQSNKIGERYNSTNLIIINNWMYINNK